MDTNNYDFLIYKRGNESKEAKSVELKIPNEMTCGEFKTICIRMAHAIGYHENSVRENFGKIEDSKSNENQLKLLLND